MIKKFNEFENVNENKWLKMLPILLSLGYLTPTKSQEIKPQEIKNIVVNNPELKADTIKGLDVKYDVNVDFVSSMIWRGDVSSKAPSIIPHVTITNKNTELMIYGATNIKGDYKEFDVILSYYLKNWKFSVSDYRWDWNKSHFDYKKETTEHKIELTTDYTFNGENPFTISLNSIVYGLDKNDDNKNIYSSYIELSYALKDITFYIGMTPWTSVYGKGSSVININTVIKKELKVNNFIIHIEVCFGINPQTKLVFTYTSIKF